MNFALKFDLAVVRGSVNVKKFEERLRHKFNFSVLFIFLVQNFNKIAPAADIMAVKNLRLFGAYAR